LVAAGLPAFGATWNEKILAGQPFSVRCVVDRDGLERVTVG
jgi:hypothetical protein